MRDHPENERKEYPEIQEAFDAFERQHGRPPDPDLRGDMDWLTAQVDPEFVDRLAMEAITEEVESVLNEMVATGKAEIVSIGPNGPIYRRLL